MTQRKKGRRQDTKLTYSPEQTQRYKSQFSRYEKGMKLATEVGKVDEGKYRIPSVRSPIGYWEITTKEDGQKLNVTWSGETRDEGEINVTWEGQKPDQVGLNVTWEGRKCLPNSPPPSPPGSGGGGLAQYDVSGCGRWSFNYAIPQVCREYNEDGGPIWTRSSVAAVINAYRAYGGSEELSDEDILSVNGGSGFDFGFAYGMIYRSVAIVFDDIDAQPVEGLPSNYVAPIWRCGFGSVDVSQGNPSSFQDVYSAAGLVTAEITSIDPPSAWESADNCDLLDIYSASPNQSPPNAPPTNPPTCARGVAPIYWQCFHPLDAEEALINWEVREIDQYYNPNGKYIDNYSDVGRKPDGTFVNYETKILEPCPASEAVDTIKIVSVDGKTTQQGEIIPWQCNYPLAKNEFSKNWQIVEDSGIIQNDQGYQKALAPCPLPEQLSNIQLTQIVNVVVTQQGQTIPWNCEYELTENEFSENWQIVDEQGIIQNTEGYQKEISPCTPPEPVENEKLTQINEVKPSKGGYECTCPDFSKKEDAFSPPKSHSMSQARNWENSDAGCPTWSDGKRRCAHIVAVQQIRDEEIPKPSDT